MESKKKNTIDKSIYVDMDDVLSASTLTFLRVLEQEFGKKYSFEDIIDFDLQKSFDLTRSEYEQFFKIIHQPDIIMNFEPVQDAVRILKKWEQDGYHIHVVTGRLTDTYSSSLAWLAKHEIPYHDFTMVDKYARKETDMNVAVSLDELSQMEFYFAVEDSLMMAHFLSTHMDTPVALMDRPWNQSSSLDGRIVRCRSWRGVSDMTASL